MDLKDYKNSPEYLKNYWWFVGKRRFIDQLLRRFFGEIKSLKILDVGCGMGDDLEIIGRYGEVMVLDSSDETLKYIPDNYRKIRCEIQNFDWPGEKFDAVVVFDVLEHVKSDAEALSRISQVLKPGGLVVALVPAGQWLWSPHDEYLGHFRRYNRRLLAHLAKGQDLDLMALGFWNNFLSLPTIVFRLGKRFFFRHFDALGNGSDLFPLPDLANRFLLCILAFESWLFRIGVNLPFGLSIYAVWRKKALASSPSGGII